MTRLRGVVKLHSFSLLNHQRPDPLCAVISLLIPLSRGRILSHYIELSSFCIRPGAVPPLLQVQPPLDTSKLKMAKFNRRSPVHARISIANAVLGKMPVNRRAIFHI